MQISWMGTAVAAGTGMVTCTRIAFETLCILGACTVMLVRVHLTLS